MTDKEFKLALMFAIAALLLVRAMPRGVAGFFGSLILVAALIERYWVNT